MYLLSIIRGMENMLYSSSEFNLYLPLRLTHHKRLAIQAHPHSAFGGTSFMLEPLGERGIRKCFQNRNRTPEANSIRSLLRKSLISWRDPFPKIQLSLMLLILLCPAPCQNSKTHDESSFF